MHRRSLGRLHVKDKVCVVTGGASGMGRITVRELASMGATVVFNDRVIDEGREARSDIVALTGNGNVEFIPCDMGDFDQVRNFAQHLLDNYSSVDVLINNAGLTDPQYIVSEDGIEQHFAIMHLGHYLLTLLLLDRMKQCAPARIIQISSDAHKAGPGINYDNIACTDLWKGRPFSNNGAFQAYHRAKLAMVHATYELAERLDGTGVTINAVSPGYFVNTNIFRHMRGFMKFGVRLFRPFFTDPERSAKTFVYLASSDEVEGVSGKYWEYCAEKETSKLARDSDLQKRTMEITNQLLGIA